MDRWILSELHLTTDAVCKSLDGYDILAASRALFDFVDRLSNWYVRRSRPRFWGPGLGEDKLDAYWTLYECLVTLSRLIAPFVPFFAESIYLNLVVAPFGDSQPESVHLCDFPHPEARAMDRNLSGRMALALEMVSLGRAARAEARIGVRRPLREAVVVLADPSRAGELADLLPLVEGELNVKRIGFATDADHYVSYRLRPNFKLIGPRLGALVQKLKPALARADAATLRSDLERRGALELEVEGEKVELSAAEIEVQLEPREGYLARASREMVLVLDAAIDDELRREWWAREVVACVNSLRGERGLPYEARIDLKVGCSAAMRSALEEHLEYLRNETLSCEVDFGAPAGGEDKEGKAGDEKFMVDFTMASGAN
jgi:isoleucyl-tRNA synthetase